MINYKTYKYAGKFDKSVTVATGAEGLEKTVIRLKGYVDPIPMGVLEMAPRKTDLGELAVGKDNQVSIVIKNTGDAELRVSRIISRKFDSVYFEANQADAIVIPAGREQKVDLMVKPVKPGHFMDIIMIYSDARNDIGNGYKGVLTGKVK